MMDEVFENTACNSSYRRRGVAVVYQFSLHLAMCVSRSLAHYSPPLLAYRDNFMSAQEALAYGLIDEIVAPHDEKFRDLTMPPPGMAPQLFGELPEGAADYQFGKIVSVE
jgi:enoyl-CoA hydratase/carnithine racemase